MILRFCVTLNASLRQFSARVVCVGNVSRLLTIQKGASTASVAHFRHICIGDVGAKDVDEMQISLRWRNLTIHSQEHNEFHFPLMLLNSKPHNDERKFSRKEKLVKIGDIFHRRAQQ